MSRGFVKNDRPDEPIIVPARAPLPPGVINYVTPRGLALLRAELTELEAERTHALLDQDDLMERARQLAALDEHIAGVVERISSAQIVGPQVQSPDTVRFGVTVSVLTISGENAGEERRFTIVGVDEANAAHGRVAFTAPIARALLGRHVGESALLRSAQGDVELEITAIEYAYS